MHADDFNLRWHLRIQPLNTTTAAQMANPAPFTAAELHEGQLVGSINISFSQFTCSSIVWWRTGSEFFVFNELTRLDQSAV